jgi:nitrite reductase (cytochrome c-552)
MASADGTRFWQRPAVYLGLIAVVAGVTAGVTALLTNIFERKAEQRTPFVRLVDVGEDDTDPAKWGKNWPAEYDSYKRTALTTKTRFGGHSGSEALPEEKIERDPWLKRMFNGYAFAIDYRDRRGHAYMLHDQEQTKRITKPQSGSCLHCHASVMPLYRAMGGGDAMKGFEESFKLSYQEMSAKLYESGHAHPVSCVDCHDPEDMSLRVTRPGFLRGFAALAASDAPVPALESIAAWRAGKRTQPYDPNRDASRNEMRSYVCGQCHVEYYFKGPEKRLTYPWFKGLKADEILAYYDEVQFKDWTHAQTGAPVLKAQHPEFEMWNQGIHARSGVACADCHMPYERVGALKISNHHVRSPVLNLNNACQTCHKWPEEELKARIETIQSRTYEMRGIAMDALIALIDDIQRAKAAGATDAQLEPARQFQRKAQFLLDFIEAENSMGFHAPQEAARILVRSVDYTRKGQEAVRGALTVSGS